MILDWYKRLEIAVNVAQGLDYLHSFAVLNSANICLSPVSYPNQIFLLFLLVFSGRTLQNFGSNLQGDSNSPFV
jgi:hypothetical protein